MVTVVIKLLVVLFDIELVPVLVVNTHGFGGQVHEYTGINNCQINNEIVIAKTNTVTRLIIYIQRSNRLSYEER